MPEELSTRRLLRRLLEVAGIGTAVALVVLVGPGLGSLRNRLAQASPGLVVAAVGLELLSAVSYVVLFRAVFCPRMKRGLSYQIGMAEQGANSVLSVSGIGGLALGAWALHRGGMDTEHIARRSVAFFFLTSMANVGGVILFAVLYALGVLGHDPQPGFTYGFGVAALAATVLVVALPFVLSDRPPTSSEGRWRRLALARQYIRYRLRQGIRDALTLIRRRPVTIIGGSLGIMVFDLAVLAVAYEALHHSVPLGVVVMGYLIGMLGGNIPIPGGIGGIDLGLTGLLVLYHQPLAVTAGAVLIYHAISLWVPAVLGSVAFVQLRRMLQRTEHPAAVCAPLAEPIEVEGVPALAGQQ